MVAHDCGENTPVTADQMVFQFVTASGTVSGGVVVVAVVARACTAGCIVLLSWESFVALFVPATVLDWATASSCAAVPESFVVFGGSLNGGSCGALAEVAA